MTDLKFEIKFCLQNELEPNEHGRFVYASTSGTHMMSIPEILSDYREFLVNEGVIKDYKTKIQ